MTDDILIKIGFGVIILLGGAFCFIGVAMLFIYACYFIHDVVESRKREKEGR